VLKIFITKFQIYIFFEIEISSKTQDNRIQIEKWDTMGKAKKVYLYWELYNIFNRIDPNRENATTRIRHSNLFRAYCKINENEKVDFK